MAKLIDVTGQTFNYLTVLKRSNIESKKVYWDCQCKCGKIIAIESYALRKGQTKSCGCCNNTEKNKRVKDLTGQKFGRLKVLGIDEVYEKQRKPGQEIKWKCQCECGNITSVFGGNLKSGHTQSCGCYSKEQSSLRNTAILTGQTFGKLTVLEKGDIRYNSCAYWKCRCECGTIIEVRSTDLKNGHTQSCGCAKYSKGEQKIKQILEEMNILFECQKQFPTLIYKRPLKFDFYLPEYNICLEYQGEQHYTPQQFFGEKNFYIQKKRDLLKKKWCESNQVKLIEIPYWDFNKIDKNYIEKILN